MKFKLGFIALGCATLTSCANHPAPPKTAIIDTRIVSIDNGSTVTILTQNAINGDVIEDTDNSLNVVSKTDNAKVAGLKALQFAAMLLGGGGGSVNGHSKEQLKGTHLNNVQNKTMEYLNAEIDRTLKPLNITSSNKKNEIIVKPYKFKLIYDGLDNNDYEFIYSTTISVGDFYYTCSSQNLLSTERIQSIDKWESNSYGLTQTMAKKVITQCFESINSGENKMKLTNALSSSGEGKKA